MATNPMMYKGITHYPANVAAGQNIGVLSRRKNPNTPGQIIDAWAQERSPGIRTFFAYELGIPVNEESGDKQAYHVVAALVALDRGHALAMRVGNPLAVLNGGRPLLPEVHDIRCAFQVELPAFGQIKVQINGSTYLITPEQILNLARHPYTSSGNLIGIHSASGNGDLGDLVRSLA